MTAFLLSLILALAGYTRMTNLPGVFASEDRVNLGGLDSYYHMRRIRLIMARFPAVPVRDTYVNHPEGAQLDWPITFDLVLATICKAGQRVWDSPLTPEVIAALSGPALGVIVCLLIFYLGRRLAGTAAGLLAAFLGALLPVLTGYAIVGRVDHHAAEPLLLEIPLLLLLGALAPAAGSRRRAILAGVALALAITVWPGSIAVALIAAASLAAAVLSSPGRGAVPRGQAPGRLTGSEQVAGVAAWMFGAAAVLMVPLSLLHPWARQGRFVYYAPSWLQPACFGVAFATFGLLLWLGKRRTLSGLQRAALLLCTPLVLFGLLLALSPDLRDTLAAARGYLGRSETQISVVAESRPLLSGGVAAAVEQYTALFVLTPALALVPILRWRRLPAGRRHAWHMILVWFLCGGALALAQLRLGSMFAPVWCALWGVLLVDLFAYIRGRLARAWLAAALLGGGVSLALLPTFALHRPVKIQGVVELVNSRDALAWLRHSAPAPGDVLDASRTPRFAVMSRWQFGHWLNYLAHQANVANPLGQTPVNLRGVRDSARFFLATDVRAAGALLDRRRARYVLVHPALGQLGSLTRHTSHRPDDFFRLRADGKRWVQPAYFRTMQVRLHHYDGRRFRLQGRVHAPLRRYRLVYDCLRRFRELGRDLSYCKIFERVPGARLVGEARPGQPVALQLPVLTNTGRRFTYRDLAAGDDRGRYVFTVPYPTAPAGAGSAVSAGKVRILSADSEGKTRVKVVEVSAKAVLGGGEIQIP